MILDTPSEIECISCGNNYVTICSYCFFLNVSRILAREKLKTSLINEFLELFNYRQGHEEYIIQ